VASAANCLFFDGVCDHASTVTGCVVGRPPKCFCPDYSRDVGVHALCPRSRKPSSLRRDRRSRDLSVLRIGIDPNFLDRTSGSRLLAHISEMRVIRSLSSS
jgi:hypothetical protein